MSVGADSRAKVETIAKIYIRQEESRFLGGATKLAWEASAGPAVEYGGQA
jgi:hypothetical protein